MNQAHLEILGITAPSKRYQFHDDGYVSSISAATMRVNELYCIDNSNYNAKADRNVIGRKVMRGLNIHIFYLRRPTKTADIQNRGHEETHVLDAIGQLDILTDKLLEEQNVRINIKEIDDGEVRAQLGSLYALHARGLSPWRLWFVFENDTFTTAKKLYKQSKLPERRIFTF